MKIKNIVAVCFILILLPAGCSLSKEQSVPKDCPPVLNIDGIDYYARFGKEKTELPQDAKCVSYLESICDLSRMPQENGVNFPMFEIGDDIYKAGDKYYIKAGDKYYMFDKEPR